MTCAYCKEEVKESQYDGIDGQCFDVEINGVECEIRLHRECVGKALGEFFSRPKETASNHHYVTTVTPLNESMLWEPKWTAGSTTGAPPEPDHKVWCKADDGSTHTPWKDRVD